MKILVINGSYRKHGMTDQLSEVMAHQLETGGAEVETVVLRDYPIAFCENCRACTQEPGSAPGECALHDGMAALVEKIEAADAYILASPTNFYSVTALFKRFMERLLVYAYWPWGAHAPVFRKRGQPAKKALLVSSCAAPGWMGRLFFHSARALRLTAKTIGARPVGMLFAGLIGGTAADRVDDATRRRAEKLARRLLA